MIFSFHKCNKKTARDLFKIPVVFMCGIKRKYNVTNKISTPFVQTYSPIHKNLIPKILFS